MQKQNQIKQNYQRLKATEISKLVWKNQGCIIFQRDIAKTQSFFRLPKNDKNVTSTPSGKFETKSGKYDTKFKKYLDISVNNFQ